MSPPPQIHVHLELQNVTLFGNKVFEDVVSKEEVILELGGVKPNNWCLYKNGKLGNRHADRGDTM